LRLFSYQFQTETNSQSSSDIQQINNVDLSREKMGKKIEAQLSEKLKNAGFDPKGILYDYV
jgi:hypothetical protein